MRDCFAALESLSAKLEQQPKPGLWLHAHTKANNQSPHQDSACYGKTAIYPTIVIHLCRAASSTTSAPAGATTESPTEAAVPKESDASKAQVIADTTKAQAIADTTKAQVIADTTKAQAIADTTNTTDASSDATVSKAVAKEDGGDAKAKT